MEEKGIFMKKLLLLCLVFIVGNIEVLGQNVYIIGSGSRGGNYYNTGDFIQSQYNYYFGDKYTFQNIETNGSIENINLLRDNKIDLAIVQRNILIDYFFNQKDGTKNIEIITPLFQEKLNIYYNGETDKLITDLPELSTKKELKIGFTSLTGYSHQIFHSIIQYLNIDYNNVVEVSGNYKNLLEAFKDKQLDLIVSFSLPLQDLDTLKERVHNIYLSENNADLIADRITNVRKTKIDSNKYSLGIWTFLIGSNTCLFQIKKKDLLVNALLKKNDSKKSAYIQNVFEKNYYIFMDNKNNENDLLRNLPLTGNLKKHIGIKNINWRFYIMFTLLIISLFVLYYLYKGELFPKISFRRFWNRYKHFQFGFLLLLIIYFASIELLIYAEKLFYVETGKKSQILNLTYKNLHSWLLVTNLTGNDNGIFPLSITGKFMVALNTLNFWIGTILVGVSEYVNYQFRKKRKEGLMETKHSNHIVIFGWDQSSEVFIKELLKDALEFHNTKLHIVSVVENIKDVLSRYPDIAEMQEQKKIDIIQGDAMDFHILEMSKVHLARVVILLKDRDIKHSDKNTVMRAFAISRFCKNKNNNNELEKLTPVEKLKNGVKTFFKKKSTDSSFDTYAIDKNSDTVYMIAELNDNYYVESLYEADVNEILIAGNYGKSALKQSVFNFGMTKVMDELLQYNKGNDFYKIDLAQKENKFMVYKTFDELLPLLRSVGILLIGIHVIFHDENLNVIIDQKIIKKNLLLEEDGLTRDIIINPTNKKEKERRVDDDDHLIVIATSMKVIKEGLKKLREEIES